MQFCYLSFYFFDASSPKGLLLANTAFCQFKVWHLQHIEIHLSNLCTHPTSIVFQTTKKCHITITQTESVRTKIVQFKFFGESGNLLRTMVMLFTTNVCSWIQGMIILAFQSSRTAIICSGYNNSLDNRYKIVKVVFMSTNLWKDRLL